MTAVGRMAGVSQVTVSRALSDPSKVSKDTLNKILEAVEITGFVPNAIAGALASNRSNLVSALIPSLTNIVYSSFIKQFANQMRRHGYQILLSECGFDAKDEEAMIEAHLSRRPDAMILTGVYHTMRARKMLMGAAIPVVEAWDVTETPIDICVGFSHQGAGRSAADYANQAGYRHAACVTANDERALRRQNAFIDRFSSVTGTDVPTVVINSQASIEEGRNGLSKLLETIEFSGRVVFCSSDLIAHGIVIEAKSRGLRIAKDVAVIGFGDQDFAAHIDPALTTVHVDRENMGLVAAHALLRRFESDSTASQVTDMGFEIVARQSA